MSPGTGLAPVCVAALLHICLFTRLAFGSFPRAQNVTWKSTNFKTSLSWEPTPSSDYSYTVEFTQVPGDRQRNPHCIRMAQTECDLSNSIQDPRACYIADVLSEPPLGVAPEHKEYPSTRSPRFCPYKDTDILSPDFKLEVSKDQSKTTVAVTDPLTAMYKDGRQLTIRDIYSDQLEYRVIYRKNKSTGKKVRNSKSNNIELTDLDRGESYCFQVQAFIPSRAVDKQLGELSQTQCTNYTDPSIFDNYSLGVIAGAILFVLLLIGIVVAVIVVCCKRRMKAVKTEKEAEALNSA